MEGVSLISTLAKKDTPSYQNLMSLLFSMLLKQHRWSNIQQRAKV